MDLLVPILIFVTLGVTCLAALAGLWALVRGFLAHGWSALVPQAVVAAWSRFWFAPRDPTVLGLMRIACGAVTTYTVFVYSFTLQEHMGKDAWYNLPLREEIRHTKANMVGPLATSYGQDYPVPQPTTLAEKQWFEHYRATFGVPPPGPFPVDDNEAKILCEIRETFGTDLRHHGLRPPRTDEEKFYVDEYFVHPANVHKRPPPAYPDFAAENKIRTAAGASVGGLLVGQGTLPAIAGLFPRKTEKQDIYDFMATHGGVDPRLAYSIGQPTWSIWYHVTDPRTINVIHGLCVLTALLFTIGFCTRVTSALTWMTSLWYIHRSHIQLFGVDTMMVILLLYLMIGPSGAALSVDRLIARWWSKAKPGVVNRWRRLIGRDALPEDTIAPAAYSPTPVASVSANFAIRMLQVHLCVIYFVSGVTKLLGPAWWNGTAVWGTLANFEFAPMAFKIGDVYVHNEFLRFLGRHHFLLEAFLTAAGLFTLAFEIGYAFLIWRPSMRWVYLGGAITLHGFIGLLMGLKTFSLMMLVFNMAFLRREEVEAFVRLCRRAFGGSSTESTGTASAHAVLPARKASADAVVAAVRLKK